MTIASLTPASNTPVAPAGVSVSATSTAPPPAVGLEPPPSAVDVAVQAAAGRQAGLASLLADLGAALQTPGLPEPVLAAAAQVLGLQLPLAPAPTGADLRQALAQSGLFLEAQLTTVAASPGPDLKAALLTLGQALEVWLGATPPAPPVSRPPAPPYAGGPVRGQPPAQANLPPGAAVEIIGARLLQQTGGAVARQVLLQAASLPGSTRSADQSQGQQWLFEVPLATPQGAAVAQFEIARDGAHDGDAEDQPVWRARFCLHLEPMGPVHAKIALRGDRAHVSLWAENAETADRLATQSAALSDALRGDDLAASISVVPGAPTVAAPRAGRLVDQAL